MTRTGVVAIGRNEGERLARCLRSVVRDDVPVVYVDSGSTDGSVETARALGGDVVSLDMGVPFTAARARNAGFDRLLATHPALEFVQFVDGDCEVVGTWMERAVCELEARPELAVVCGRRRERFPEASVYNRLCDIEWDTPIGDARACGGDAMMRVSALKKVGGFDPSLIAGEEPELCVRLRGAGWKIARVDAEMTLHDAAMMRFGQWWKRSERAGHAYAEGAAMHGGPPERHWVREVRNNWVWGLVVPALAIGLAWPTRGMSLLLLAGYGVLFWKIRRYSLRRGLPPRHASVYAAACVIGKIPQVAGQLKYRLGRLVGRRSAVMEYKQAAKAIS